MREATISATGDRLAFLVFAIEAERFGIRAASVREVVRAVAISKLPVAPPLMEGVINFRGQVVPVLDIRARFDLPSAPLRSDQHFVVASAGARLVGLRVDRALELLEVPGEDFETATSAAPGARLTEGVVRLPDGLLVIHDLERFLSLEDGEKVDAAVAPLIAESAGELHE